MNIINLINDNIIKDKLGNFLLQKWVSNWYSSSSQRVPGSTCQFQKV